MDQLARLSRDIGKFNAVLYATSRLFSFITFGRGRLNKYYISALAVPGGDITPPRRGKHIAIMEAGPADIDAMAVDRPRHVLETRFQNGCRCLVALSDGAFAGFQWFTTRDYLEDEVRCLFRLAPDDRCAWDFDIFVAPAYRVLPVFSRLWDACNQLLRDSGIRMSVSRIDAFNGASRRAHERIGARVVGWALFICLGPAQVTIFSGSPYLHASMTPSSIPVVPASTMAEKGFDHSAHQS